MQQVSDWGLLSAAFVCAICAVIAAAVAVAVWRKSKVGGDLTARITAGDRVLRKHTDRSITEVRQKLEALDERMDTFEEGQGRLMQEMQHCLKARDLGPIHEKINQVAERLAANNATTQAVREQLHVLSDLIVRGNRS